MTTGDASKIVVLTALRYGLRVHQLRERAGAGQAPTLEKDDLGAGRGFLGPRHGRTVEHVAGTRAGNALAFSTLAGPAFRDPAWRAVPASSCMAGTVTDAVEAAMGSRARESRKS